MHWMEAAMIMFSCVAANHLGLVAAIESIIHRRIPVVNCPKCFTFWSVLVYSVIAAANSSLFTLHFSLMKILAASFLFSYLATWLNLLFAVIDHFYNHLYDALFSTTDTTDDGA